MGFNSAFKGLIWGPRTLSGSMDKFQGVVNLDGKKIITLFPPTSEGNLGFHSVMDVGSKEIYCVWILKIFNVNKYHCGS